MIFPLKPYYEFVRDDVDFRIALLHHPLNWYAQATYHPLRKFLLDNFCSVISGHEHVSSVHQILEEREDRTGTQMIAAGALGPHIQDERSEFQLLSLNADEASLDKYVYVWNNSGLFEEQLDARRSHPLPLRTSKTFELKDEYKEQLEDIGAPFSHPSVERLRLSDVYVEPQFRWKKPFLEDETISGLSFLKAGSVGRIIVYGDDHYGKTSYLSRAVFKGLELGYVPLYISRKDIASGSNADRDKNVRNVVKQQYGERAAEKYFSVPKDKRLIVLDDLDRLAENEDAYVRVLKYLIEHSDNCIVTVNERFDPSVLGSAEVSRYLSTFEECRLLGFSYVLRGALIERWYALDRALPRNDFNRKVHAAQEHLDAAIGKGLIPSTPFNTLLILQALETAQRTQVVDASIAQHYDMLLRQRLTESGAQPKRLDGIYAFLAKLAWWMKSKGSNEIDRTELEAFAANFSKQIAPVDLSAQLDLLLRARILHGADNLFRFKYPSARYFFLAHHISESIEDDDALRALVRNACRHLYVKENANLIVFLTNKVASKWIIKEVMDVLSSILNSISPLNLMRDSKQINLWITSTARIAVDDTSDDRTQNRVEFRRQQEEAEQIEAKDSDFNQVDDINELDIFTRINLVFKTSEILGLILKSRYGSLSAELKNEMARELYFAPLRAVALFLSAVNQAPDALVESLTAAWQDKEMNKTKDQLRAAARKFIFFALGAYSLALITRQGSIIGSPDLTHVYSGLIEKYSPDNQGDEFGDYVLTLRIVTVAARLSYPGEVPMSEIEKLAKELRSNAFGWNLLQGLIAHHLYMFPVKYDLKQRLAHIADIDLKKQVAQDAIKSDEKNTRNFKSRNSQSLIQRLSKSFLMRNSALIERALGKNK